MRLYVSRLLQWIDHDYLRPICEVLGDVLDHNHYLTTALDPGYSPHVNKPEPYRHHLLVFPVQLQSIGAVEGRNRFALVVGMLEQARLSYAALDGVVVLNPRSDGSHIPPWLTAANLFGRQKGWI